MSTHREPYRAGRPTPAWDAHGVQALRLTPVGEASMYGRDGMLAHTYMLGPNGQSNGCVSFKDYDRFLAAFSNGEVEQLIVVPKLTATAFAQS